MAKEAGMRIVRREDLEDREDGALSADAARAARSEGRDAPAAPDRLRTEFQRDRDKILHTKSFRRLSHKTQVFIAVEGDHFRTRLTHTLEVAQVARTIARALGLNEDLTEAISLGHDLGHTPFGHAGERALRACIARHRGMASDDARVPGLFRHNEQSLRVLEVIEGGGRGLNLTAEVCDGIVRHTGKQRAKTLEGRVVAIADRIAYVNHDIDDAIRAGILKESELPERTHALLGCDHSSRIETLVVNMVETSAHEGDIRLSDDVGAAMNELRTFLFQAVYTAPSVMAQVDKAVHVLSELFEYFVAHIEDVPSEYRAISPNDDVRAATDYVASMTDRYARGVFEELFIPRSRIPFARRP